jgi:hypothetical protein
MAGTMTGRCERNFVLGQRLGGRVERIIKRVITCEETQKRAVARSARKSEGRRWKKGRKRRGRSRMPPFDHWKPPFDHR